MQPTTRSVMLRISGFAAIGAGVLFFATVGYLFGVLPRAGFTFEMLDDRASLLPWVAAHERLYGGLWVLYFVAQALVLPLPGALARLVEDDGWGAGVAFFCAKLGYAAILLAMVGLILIYTTSPLVARAYVATTSQDTASIVLLGDLFAGTGKEIRLFGELLLGVWLGGTGAVLLRLGRSRIVASVMLAVGVYTLLVAGIKIADPFTPLEDTLGIFMALGYVAIGSALVRQRGEHAAGEQPRRGGSRARLRMSTQSAPPSAPKEL